MKLSVLFTLGITSLSLSTAAEAQLGNTSVSKDNSLPKDLIAMTIAPVASAVTSENAPAATKDFKGTVVDEMGEPLAGAVVSIISGKNQFSVTTTTNAEGEYVISTTTTSPLLLVTYAGYIDVQQKATYAHPITFQLEAIDNYDHQLKKQAKAAEKAWRK